MAQDKDNKDKAFQMRVDESFTRMVDDWRGKQRPIPSRSEAVRQLVEIAVKVTKKG
jgi:hypothetical protein